MRTGSALTLCLGNCIHNEVMSYEYAYSKGLSDADKHGFTAFSERVGVCIFSANMLRSRRMYAR